MQYSVFLLLAGAFLSALLSPLSIRCARRLGAVDHPDGIRHLHACPTPRLGGLAIFAAVLSLSLFLAPSTAVSVWLSGGALIAALGVTDDLYSLSPTVKLAAMLAICALPAAFGIVPRLVTLGTLRITIPHPIGNIASLLWVLLLCNAFNLIDGADGLCASLALVGAFSLFLVHGSYASLLLFGAVLGFLPYNLPLKHPRRRNAPRGTHSFLGDTGALFLGYSLAVFSLDTAAFSIGTPLFFALPVFDLIRVFSFRLLRGKNPFRADRTHLHHRLAKEGYRTGEILVFCLLYGILFAAVGIVSSVLAE